MVDQTSLAATEDRLRGFLAAELRQAESDFPHLSLPKREARRGLGGLGVLAIVGCLVAALVLVRPWGALPAAPGADPRGSDGIPLSIAGESVVRGVAIDVRLASSDTSPFLAGGYLILHPAPCPGASPTISTPSPLPSATCDEDWRLEDTADGQPTHAVRVTTVPGGATFVRTSGAPTVFRVKPVVDEVNGGLGSQNGQVGLLIEAVPWRQATKGPIPPNASPPEGGEINMALVPDFVSAWGGPTGETIVGYIPKGLLLEPATVVGGSPGNPPAEVPLPVYGEDLTTLVGHMVAGRGFVPIGGSPLPASTFAPRASTSASGAPSSAPPTSTATWGPLAVVPPQAGADTARNEGTLRITDKCVFLERAGDSMLLYWPADRAAWHGTTRTITFTNFDGTIATVGDGDQIVLGGSGDNASESGTTGQEWVARTTWVAPPDASCPLESRWAVGAIGD